MDIQALKECLVILLSALLYDPSSLSPPPELLQAVRRRDRVAILPLLDAELARSGERLRRLGELRSSLSIHVNAMPPELLSRIFLSYAVNNDALANLRWTKILLVCRHWHDIGIHTAELWTSIHVVCKDEQAIALISRQEAHARDVRRIELQRSRAGEAALDIQMDLYTEIPDVKRPYTLAFWNPESLRSLKLQGSNVYISDTLRAMALHPHPRLQALDLDVSKLVKPHQTEPLESAEFLDDVLKQCPLCLRRLYVQDIAFSWPLVNGLRSLLVVLSYTPNLPRLHARDLMAAVARCPLLQYLNLQLPPDSTISDTTTTSASLPRLTKTYIKADSDVCGNIFHSLKDLPASAEIVTSVNISAKDMADATVSYIANHIHSKNAPVIRGVCVERATSHRTGTRYLGLHGQLRLNPQRLFQADPASSSSSRYVALWVTILPGSPDDTNALVVNAARVFSFPGVSWLDLRCSDWDVPDGLWGEVFDAIPTANTVILHAGPAFAGKFLKTLHNILRLHGKRPFANIIIDVAGAPGLTRRLDAAGFNESSPKFTRVHVMRALLYCADAARAGCALNTVQVVHDHLQTSHSPKISHYALFVLGPELDWSELYQDLNEEFVYNGVLYGQAVGPEGVERDSYAVLS